MKKNTFKYTIDFDTQYSYEGGDLGVTCGEQGTFFKLWAPFAVQVTLCLYNEGGDIMELPINSTPGEDCSRYAMNREDRGVWSVAFPENMHGTWYDYLIEQNGETVRTADPYAKACSCNGCRSMVVDLRNTDPEGFLQDKAPAHQQDNVIYELHIQDFSKDANSGIPGEYRGKYKAFTVSGTELSGSISQEGKVEENGCGGCRQGDRAFPTGVDYLKALGVTHVHLLPFFDFGWLDEAGDDKQFNWGYDPVNYNVPEGSYATDACDGTVRIRECKEMIQALHKAGIRVIMDVVYNHTYVADSWLERTAPGYFCRRNENGTFSNGSACGSDLAVGRAMVDNYISHSVMYWAEEYHIDGFRFDLMGLLTTELVNRIQGELDERFGAGEKFLYGEPWRAGESPMEKGTHAALKTNMEFLNRKIAVFSDDTRDAIKGDVFFAKVPGFVNGGKGLEERILDAAGGWRENTDGFRPKACGQVINYVSAHDNFTLWDKLMFTVKGEVKEKEEYLIPDEKLIQMNKLAAFIYFTCQGNLFFQAGEEFGRTKFGDDNSFRSAPEVNMLRWEQTRRFSSLVEYYKGLIALRKKLPGLCDKSPEAIQRISGQNIHREGVVSYLVDNESTDNEAKWDTLFIVYNSSDAACQMEAPEGEWELLADGEEADCCRKTSHEFAVAAHSGLLLGRSRKGSS